MDHNGELLGTGSADKTVRLWSGVSLNMFRTTAEQQVRELQGQQRIVCEVTVHPVHGFTLKYQSCVS